MACLWMDGFEIDFANNTAGIWTQINGASGTISYTSTAAGIRTGGGCFDFTGTATNHSRHLQKTLASSYTEVYFGFGMYMTANANTNNAEGYAVFLQLGSVLLAIQEGGGQLIGAFRGATSSLLGTSTPTGLSTGVMHYLEGHIIISATVGVVQIKLDDALVIDLSSQNTGTTAVSSVLLGMVGSSTGTWYYDDFILNDTSGSVSNSWPAGAGIEMLTPNADGNYSAWTSTGGAVDYTEIDDVASYGSVPDDDTTTILSQTTAQRTSVALTNTTLTGDVQAVSLNSYCKSDGPAVDTMSQSVRLSATDYDSTAFAPPASYTWHTDILTLNPGTTAQWTTSEIDGMELGFYRVT